MDPSEVTRATQPGRSASHSAAVALVALLLGSPTHADAGLGLDMTSAGGELETLPRTRPPRPSHPARPTTPARLQRTMATRPSRPSRMQRPTRPPRPGRLPPAEAPSSVDPVAPPPRDQPSTDPAMEPPAGVPPVSPPTDVLGVEGDLRLVGRVDVNGFATGALQVFLDGAYGAVCNTNFNSVDADVACRQLGFVGGTVIPAALRDDLPTGQQLAIIADILAPMVLENLACTGAEARLVDCPGPEDNDAYVYTYDPFGYGYEDSRACDPLGPSYAFVACGTETGPETGDLRLAGGQTSEVGTARSGRLEVFNDGGWGSVCDRTGRDSGRTRSVGIFSDASVDVACKQLGFLQGFTARQSLILPLEQRRIPTWLAGASCTGNEDALIDCPVASLRNNTEACGQQNVLTIFCFNGPNPDMDGELRLAEGAAGGGYEYGRLEIFIRGFWSTICDRGGFTPDAAQVACRALGYDGGAALGFKSEHGAPGTENEVLVAALPVGLASVDCDGTETTLLDCTSSQSDQQNCGRFIGNTTFTDATVLACANTVASCDRMPPTEEGSVRLRGGFGSPCDPVHSGFVEVFHDNEWGAICDQGTNDRLAADVVCRQLGFPHGTLISIRAITPDQERMVNDYGQFFEYGPPEVEQAEEEQTRFWLTPVSCRGPEKRLVDCILDQGFLSDNSFCGGNVARMTVACRAFPVTEALENVTTPGAEEGDVRLVEQTTVANWQIGRLEIFFEGSWGQVCARKFDNADADVACRQLGFGAGSTPTVASTTGHEQRLVYPEVALTTPGCNGTEATLLACSGEIFEGTAERGCLSATSEGLVLACVTEPEAGEEGAVRLTDDSGSVSTASGSGSLEIFHAGAWGTICLGREPRGNNFVEVVCRELGFDGPGGISFTSERSGQGLPRPPWDIPAVQCTGQEATLRDCGGFEFADTIACRFSPSIDCTPSSPAAADRREARLVGGRADPGGAWAYGRLEISDGAFFSGVLGFGRRAAQVACRSLGFASGAEMVSGRFSALPGPSGDVGTIARVSCRGDEATLADCQFPGGDYFFDDSPFDDELAVAVICSSPSGCSVNSSAPVQGDVRLVDLAGITAQTSPCDAVHFGGVEFFNVGRWGRICPGRSGVEIADFAIDAQVICRQLGFRFGGLYDTAEATNSTGSIVGADYEDYGASADLVWATDVQCTGLEERLDECFFPEAFGTAIPGDNRPPVEDGVRRVSCRRMDGRVLGVVCRQFEIEESEVIRRL